MAIYTYLFADLRTNAILAELPLAGVGFEQILGGAGSFNATLALGDPKVAKLDPLGSTEPERTAIYVDRDGVLVWGGILWTRRWGSSARQLQLAGNEFWSYARRRHLRTTKTYEEVDQLEIAQDLLNWMQSLAGGDIGLVVGTETSGVLRDRTYYGYELKQIGEAVEQLSRVEGGFEFAVDVRYGSSGTPEKILTLSYPRRGRTVDKTGLVFELPGNINDYDWPEDGTTAANASHAVGAGEGDSMLSSVAHRPDRLDAGYPLLEQVVAYKDVSEFATLDAHARADVAAATADVRPTITVRADTEPRLGSYITGDDARVRITDDRWPSTAASAVGLDTFMRIVGISVDPPSAGTAEQVNLTTIAA